jgi:3-methyl-2-oxobutanoate hydroxymethyltransferase
LFSIYSAAAAPHRRIRHEYFEDALAFEDSGCFMLEFEAVLAKITKLISGQLTIPMIGIGPGVGCDGQILLCHDLLGMFTNSKPIFTKRYAKLTETTVIGIAQWGNGSGK